MGTPDQDVDAISAHDSDEKDAEEAEEKSGVRKSQGHSQNSATQAAFEQVYEGVQVPKKSLLLLLRFYVNKGDLRSGVVQFAVLERVVIPHLLILTIGIHEGHGGSICRRYRNVIFVTFIAVNTLC